MRQLAIECATQACSIALFDDGELIAHFHEILGRGHAERLIPLIADMPDKGKAEHILVSRGPGSFTGVRIGLAAARALGFAWDAKVFGYPTLALVAATARHENSAKPLSVAMHGGHGEYFCQDFDGDGMHESEPVTLPPHDAAAHAVHDFVAGTMAKELVCARGHGTAATTHPDARHVLSLPEALITDDLTPIYGREPDAKPSS